VVNGGGKLDETVEKPLVVGPAVESEPVVFPSVVSLVVIARVENRDAGTERRLHTSPWISSLVSVWLIFARINIFKTILLFSTTVH
jgi:hypothetical protein